MKRSLIVFAAFCSIVAFITYAYAAGSCTVKPGNRSDYTAEIIWTCTGDAADGSIPDSGSVGWESLFKKYPYAYRVWIENLSTDADVSTDSDVYLYTQDSSGTKSNDIMNGQGVDQLDPDVTNYIRLNQYDELHGPVTLDVDNQASASAVYRVKLVISK